MDGAAPDTHTSWSTQHTPKLHSSSPEVYSATPFASPAHRMLSPTWHPQMALSYMGSLHVPAVCSSVWQLLGNGEAIPDAPGVNPLLVAAVLVPWCSAGSPHAGSVGRGSTQGQGNICLGDAGGGLYSPPQ